MTPSSSLGLALVALIAIAACSTETVTSSSHGSSGQPASIEPATTSPSSSASLGVRQSQTPAPSSSATACPTDPTLGDIIALDQEGGPLTAAFRPLYGTYAVTALSCYGDKELGFDAFVAAPEGLGGIEEYRIEPLWLVGRGHWIAVDDSMEPEGFASGPFLPIAVSPTDETSFSDLNGRWVRVRGHFSDPAADTCRVSQGAPPTAPTAADAIQICSTSFVLTSIEALQDPSP